MKRVLLPSLLSADFYHLDQSLEAVERAGVQHLHLDVMDGQFVPNISFGPGLIQRLRPHTELFFDTHLMVNEPDFMLESFQKAGSDLITVHWEAVKHLDRTIQHIHDLGMLAGVSLNPATPVNVLDAILPELDLVLIMSVNPGFGGQSYRPMATEKIGRLRRMIDQTGKEIRLEVDGGINPKTLNTVLGAGADWIVAGSAVFGAADITQTARDFRERIESFQL